MKTTKLQLEAQIRELETELEEMTPAVQALTEGVLRHRNEVLTLMRNILDSDDIDVIHEAARYCLKHMGGEGKAH